MMGFGLIWVVLVVIGVAVLARNGSGLDSLLGSSVRARDNKDDDVNAESILNQRYARGELTRDQFRTMKKDLEG
ncbi:MAG: SHOCT domain-containing protein [Anaerolineales bacterium]